MNLPSTTLIFLFAVMALAVPGDTSACSVPVFRYALDNWPGNRDPEMVPSPLLEKIANHLVSGYSAVWIQVDSGNKEADDLAFKRLNERLTFFESVAVLPHIDPNDPSNRIGPGPELAIRFIAIRVDRTHPISRKLAGPNFESLRDDEAWIAPVFGRGRVLGAWPASLMNEEGIDEACFYLTGACSCQVKVQNPGWDLTMNVDWDERLLAADSEDGPPVAVEESSGGDDTGRAGERRIQSSISTSHRGYQSHAGAWNPPLDWRHRHTGWQTETENGMRKLVGIIFIVAALIAFWIPVRPSKKRNTSVVVSCPPELSNIIERVGGEYSAELNTKVSFHKTGTLDLVFGRSVDIALQKNDDSVKEVIPVTTAGEESLNIGVSASCLQPAAALRFARFLTAPQRGGRILAEMGFEPFPGDEWAVKPDLILYSGSVNRPAVEKLLAEFSEREGIDLTTVFNGCGILCAAMQTMTDPANPRFPDAYYACDLCFVPPVAKHFNEVVLLTETDIGIAVPATNPHNIKTLTDLARPGLKVGLCNQEQSTLGYLTQGILKFSGLDASIRKNVVVGVPTADFLITQLRSGALDAAIVYRVNAELQKADIKFIKIKHEGARAVQPFSVRSDSPKRQLAKRLQEHFLANPDSFRETGFRWRGDQGILRSSEIEVPEWLRKP